MTFARYAGLFRRLAVAADVLVVTLSFVAAYFIRDRALARAFGDLGDLRPFDDYLWLLILALPVWIASLAWFGMYRSLRYRTAGSVVGTVVRAQAVAGLVLLSILFAARRWDVSRLLTQVFLGVSLAGLVGEKLAMIYVLRWLRVRGESLRQVVIVGALDRATRYVQLLREHPYWGVRVLGVLDGLDGNGSPDAVAGAVSGSAKDLPDVLWRQPVDEVVFTVLPGQLAAVSESLDLCQEMGVTTRIVLDVARRTWTRQYVEWVGGTGILSLEPVEQSLPKLAVKRAIDVAGALLGLVILGAAYLWYAPRIRRESAGSAIFKQPRVGRNGRVFTIYKFRTMYVDAEGLREYFAHRNEMRGAMFKLHDDPRVTPLGRQMRSRHLDEFPQFWNVLRGDMSLVGTRPPTLDEVAQYRPHHRRRLSMKPGITGLWQLAGNGSIRDFEQIVKLDCQYIDSWSNWRDLHIIARTVAKLAKATGW